MRNAGGLLKESPAPPELFPNMIVIARNRRGCMVPGFFSVFFCGVTWWVGGGSCDQRGGLPVWSPVYSAFSLLSCPHPPIPPSPHPPSPPGKGEIITLFRRGLRPRHPCIKPFAALTAPANQVPSGGRAPGVAGAAGVGGTLRGHGDFGRLHTLPLACFPAPIPLPALAERSSPPGKGEILGYFMQGASPLASPGAEPMVRRKNRKKTVPYEQCRQPRRGGTGGEELRRLRWSSPPGQVEQVPSGASPQKSHRFVRFRIFCPCSDRQTAPGQRTPPAGQQSQARNE